jgi:outer membrane protein OmpA-like peptidoglycan-associated protein
MSRHLFMAIPVAVLALGGSTACATKKFVRTSVSEVNDKVDSLGRSVEETQERTRRNEGRITEVDQKAAAAQSSADKANSAAAAADSAARAAGDSATTANNKVETLNKTVNRLVYEVVLSEDEGNFKFNNIGLPDEAKARLDELISQMKADPKGAFFEIEGHTDNVGPNEVNERIGLERAEAVKRYLYEHHQIPLHKINVISYGEAKPVAENKTKEGRAQNRRIVVRVLA